jgi:hypothetical protein
MAESLQSGCHNGLIRLMTRERGLYPSRNAVERRLIWALAFVIAGLGGGALLGMIVVGKGLDGEVREAASFAGLSANPDAHITETAPAAVSCPGCADSYGVAARLRAQRETRMSEPFRRLGEVDVDMPPPPEANDGYRYGGRLPDPAPPLVSARRGSPAMVVPVGLSATSPEMAQRSGAKQQKGPGEAPEPPAIPEPE